MLGRNMTGDVFDAVMQQNFILIIKLVSWTNRERLDTVEKTHKLWTIRRFFLSINSSKFIESKTLKQFLNFLFQQLLGTLNNTEGRDERMCAKWTRTMHNFIRYHWDEPLPTAPCHSTINSIVDDWSNWIVASKRWRLRLLRFQQIWIAIVTLNL